MQSHSNVIYFCKHCYFCLPPSCIWVVVVSDHVAQNIHFPHRMDSSVCRSDPGMRHFFSSFYSQQRVAALCFIYSTLSRCCPVSVFVWALSRHYHPAVCPWHSLKSAARQQFSAHGQGTETRENQGRKMIP